MEKPLPARSKNFWLPDNMLIDLVVALLMAVALFKGLSRGLIIAVFSFLAFFIGLAAAVKLSAVAASYLGDTVNVSARWLPAIAFFAVFFVVVLMVRLGAKALEGMARLTMLGCANKIGGVLFYMVLYLMICSIVLFYATQLNLIKPEAAKVSITYSYIYPLGPKVIDAMGFILPWFRDMFGTLETFFGRFGKTA